MTSYYNIKLMWKAIRNNMAAPPVTTGIVGVYIGWILIIMIGILASFVGKY